MIERALETQRLRLLRILAGLLLVVVIASLGPVSGAFSVRVREFVGSILSRLEAAMPSMVMIQARLLAVQGDCDVDRVRLFQSAMIRCPHRREDSAETVPSLVDLRARLGTLRKLLENLPRYGMRLLRRATSQQAAKRPRNDRAADLVSILDDFRLIARRVDRPPD